MLESGSGIQCDVGTIELDIQGQDPAVVDGNEVTRSRLGHIVTQANEAIRCGDPMGHGSHQAYTSDTRNSFYTAAADMSA